MGSDGIDGVSTTQTQRPSGQGVGPIVDWAGKLWSEILRLVKDPGMWASGVVGFGIGLTVGWLWSKISKRKR
jgi:hypothetical protein